MTDSELLLEYIRGSEKAFAELVRRHIDLVFAAALRHVAGDRQSAEDITQKVFIDLARKARSLAGHPTLPGWLYSSTRYSAINTRRGEQRRLAREKQFDAMNTAAADKEPGWEQIRPVIDDVLQELDESDRQSVVLRFFGQQSFATIATQLGISENAAQKRVDRALDRLNVALKRRGVSSTAVALGLALAESGVAAPVSLVGTVTTTALASAVGAGAGVVAWAGGLKIAAIVVTVGTLGWVGFGWLRPALANQMPPPPLTVTEAKPAAVEIGSKGPADAETPQPIEPEPRKPVEQIHVKPAPVATPTPAPRIYVVAPGDTLKRIASAVGVTPEALRAENPGYNFPLMKVGEYVRLPANANFPLPVPAASEAMGPAIPIPADQVYIIQPGDTLLKIAQKKDLLPGELEALNPQINWQRLRVGQKIRAP